MMHVKQIQKIIDEGRTEEAHEALEQLLCLGPHNTEALKLRAMLYGQKGRFAEEARAWERIITIDGEDPDAISYFRLRHLEDREHFYFTDDLPDGGRRFIAYPKSLVRSTFYALGGCLSFLCLSRLAVIYPAMESPAVLMPIFTIFVILPWIWTITAWLRAIRYISLTRERIEFSTRIKTLWLEWKAVQGVYLVHNIEPNSAKLSLVIIPIDPEQPAIDIDLSVESSAIRARSYLLKEVATLYGEPIIASLQELKLGSRPVLKF
jgi:tetratricopeptide (TPR) repeat protein